LLVDGAVAQLAQEYAEKMKKNGKLESSPQSARAGCSESVH